MVFAGYGELHDEEIDGLEEHLAACPACRNELEALRRMQETLALEPMVEPSPNLLAQSRMRLDEELDLLPAHGFLTRMRSLFFGSLANIQNSPALTLLLIGTGFFAGYFTLRYQVAHAPRPTGPRFQQRETDSTIANVSGIIRTPDSEIVQVKYDRIVPETIEGSLDEPEIRKLLMLGSLDGATSNIREQSVAALVEECKAGHRCPAESDGKGIRGALLVALRYDRDAAVRLKALEGLQPYIAQDKHVRDAVLDSLLHDPNANVRAASVSMLPPVQADSSVRRVLRTLSREDANPYIRTVSYNALQSSGDVQ
jgi:anti-sigma factor RsiW